MTKSAVSGLAALKANPVFAANPQVGGSDLVEPKLMANPVFAANPQVGGSDMFEPKMIVETAVTSPVRTTLVAAVKAAGLVDALTGPGPFTVSAPINGAFAALPTGTVDTVLMTENKGRLTTVLAAHGVAGDVKLDDLRAKMGKDGHATLKTLSGDALPIRFCGDTAVIYFESCRIGSITVACVDQSNGLIHINDAVIVPKQDGGSYGNQCRGG